MGFAGGEQMTRVTSNRLRTLTTCSAAVLSLVLPSSVAMAQSSASLDSDAGGPRGGQWSIVATYAIPEGASGLAYDGTYLYCGIYGANGGQIYQIDPNTGASALLFTGPQGDAFGLTYDGQYLWTTHHPSNPAVALQLDWDGTVIDQFSLPAQYVSGIAYDEGNFWVTRYYPDPGHVYKLASGGSILDQFSAPDNQPWDLCIENGNLWMADYWGDALYKINTTTGELIESHPSEGVDPAGVVWDGKHLWYCDNGQNFAQDFLYKVDLQGGGTPAIAIPAPSHDFGTISIGSPATWNMTVQNTGTADLNISGVSFDPVDDLSTTTSFPLVIAAGGNDQIAITFDPNDFNPLDATVTVSSDDPINPQAQATVSGHGVYPAATLGLAQSAHDYGAVRTGAHTRWFMQITNQGNSLLTISDIVSDDAAFYLDEAVSFPINLATLASVNVGVWFNPAMGTAYAGAVTITSNDPNGAAFVALSGSGVDTQYPMSQSLWSYLIDTDFDNSPKAMAPIPDVSGDGIADLIVCSEDYYVRCFNGNAHGTGDVLWEHEIFSGSVYSEAGLDITADLDGDGYDDVVVAAAWGARLIRAISGKTGLTIWTHDTHEYGGGGWVYAVDGAYDYNTDGIPDVLAVAGDDATDTGPKRVYCLNGLTGLSIWERPLGGPGFGVIGVEDFTGDARPDVVVGASNEGETQGRVYGIDGSDGTIEWTFIPSGTSAWALKQLDDITSDGVRDIIVGDFSLGGGAIYGLDATNGAQQYSFSGYGGIRHFADLGDVNGDGLRDVAVAHFGPAANLLNGQTGVPIWSVPLVDQAAVLAAAPDLNDDGVPDIMLGTFFNNNYGYFLDGADGTVLDTFNYGTPVDALAAIPDIVGDGSWEMVLGGRNGLVTCYSGGVGADCNANGMPDWQDFDDLPAFTDCMAGPDSPPMPTDKACAAACLNAFDSNGDEDVDVDDFAEFMVQFTGP
jgi:hypothetical protein